MIKLAEESLCTGCALCHDVCVKNAISMCQNKEGFYYPVIDTEKCIECGKCQKECPVINDNDFHKSKNAFYGRVRDNIEKNSSGGFCEAFADTILQMDGVVFGAVLMHDKLAHKKGTTETECSRMSGSKYIQSDMQDVYRQIKEELEKDKPVLFTGCPCQCAAVVSDFKNSRYYDKLYVCEILCHGVPSPGIFQDWIAFLEKKYNSRVSGYNFRSKKNGWSRPSVEIVFENGKRIVQTHSESNYHMWFGKHLSLRLSCYECKYRNIERIADLTIGDFWGIRSMGITDQEIEKGTSVLLVNTDKGADLLDRTRREKDVFLKDISIDDAYINNTPSLHNFPKPAERDSFFAAYQKESIAGIRKKYPAEKKMISLLRKVKHILKK